MLQSRSAIKMLLNCVVCKVLWNVCG